jgi:hypothetical protein
MRVYIYMYNLYVLAGSAIKLDGGWCIDGGLSDFQPRLPPTAGETVYVNPFYFSDADIKPSR